MMRATALDRRWPMQVNALLTPLAPSPRGTATLDRDVEWSGRMWTSVTAGALSHGTRHLAVASGPYIGQGAARVGDWWTGAVWVGNPAQTAVEVRLDIADSPQSTHRVDSGAIKLVTITRQLTSSPTPYVYLDIALYTPGSPMLIGPATLHRGTEISLPQHGDSPGWRWLGTPHASPSAGPARPV